MIRSGVSAVLVLVVALVTTVTVAHGDPAVISVIKPNRSGAIRSTLGVPLNGRFRATNVTAFELVAAAYGGVVPLDGDHVKGVPSWAKSERFDVEAKAEEAEPVEDSEEDSAVFAAFAMVRTMLAERFHLKTHNTTRDEPVYAIVKARAGTRAALKPTPRHCDAISKAGPFSGPPPGVDPAMWVPCGVRVRRGEILSAGGTLEQLARQLSRQSGIKRNVVDRSGVPGRFDFVLQWTPPQPAAPPSDGAGTTPVVDVGPSLFTVLEEQLGLRLESARGPVPVLVIDRMNRPTPN